MEFGPRGTFTLRVVQPVFADGKLLGYVELGKEIEDALSTLRSHRESWNQMAVIVQKVRLNRQTWEDAQRKLGREADWDRMPNHVVVFASQGHLSDAFVTWADQESNLLVPRQGEVEVFSDGKHWRIVPTPLRDASGARIGDLLTMRDITADRSALIWQLVLGGSVGLLLLGLVLVLVYRLLTRADRQIIAQQASLRDERWRLGNIIDATRAGTWEWDVTTGSVLINERWAEMLGFTCQEFGTMDRATWERLFHSDDLLVAKGLLERHFSGALPFLAHECRLKHKEGHWVWIRSRGSLVTRTEAGAPQLMFGTHMDITERKNNEAEREQLMQRHKASELAEMMQSNRLVGLGTLMAGLAHDFNHPAQVVLQNQRSLRSIVEASVEVAKTQSGNAVGLLSWDEIATLAPTLFNDLEGATTYLQELIENVRSYANPNCDNKGSAVASCQRCRTRKTHNADTCDAVDRAVLTGVSSASLRLVSSYAKRRQVALASRFISTSTCPTSNCSWLQQVVVNLLINAIQATHQVAPSPWILIRWMGPIA